MINVKFLIVAAVVFVGQISIAATKFSILQGTTSDTVTHFTVVVRAGDSVRFQATAGLRHLDPDKIERVGYPGSIWSVYRMRFSGLAPNVQYQLNVTQANGEVTDQRFFKTLDTQAKTGRMAVVSCMVRQFHNPFLWNNLGDEANRPDAMLLIGDSVYLDRDNLLSASPPTSGLQAWESFAASRNTLNLYFWEHLVPIFSIWDDHDAGGNNVTAESFPLMPVIRTVYDTFFANEDIPGFLTHGPGMAKTFRLFGDNWVMLDGRSFRELDDASPYFGKDQEQWLLQNLSSAGNFVVSGTQFYGKYIEKDSYEFDYPEASANFTAMVRAAGEAKDAKIVFVSGDTHFSEVQLIEPEIMGYPTYEITSSSAHSFALPGHYMLKPYNPRRIEVTGTHNVVLMEFNDSPFFTFDVRSMGWRGGDLFKTTLKVDGRDCETELKLAHRS